MYRHCVTDPPPALISPLVTATMEHAHGHGSAPDHHETRFITMDHGGGGGPVPGAASPNKLQHRPNLKLGDFGRFLRALLGLLGLLFVRRLHPVLNGSTVLKVA